MTANRSDSYEDWKRNQAVGGSAPKAPSTGDQGAPVSKGQTKAPTSGSQDAAREGQQLAEVVVGEIIGWRWWWGMANVEGWFRSLVFPLLWQPGSIVKGRPWRGNQGVYAYLSFEEAWEAALEWNAGAAYSFGYLVGGRQHQGLAQRWRECRIIGEVELWGDVRQHNSGWRASYASIRSIVWAGDRARFPAQEWAEIYGVEYQPDQRANNLRW